MTTLPRTSKQASKIFTPPPPAVSHAFFAQLTRHQSDFDAGINTSVAWAAAEHLDRGTLSDEDPNEDPANVDDELNARPARALYQFEGKPEFRELSVDAGDVIEVLKEDLADGWSLVKNVAGEVGLLPRTYYTVNENRIGRLCDLD